LEKVDILRIDDRGRIVIPQSVREILNLPVANECKLIAIWSENKPEVRLEPIDVKDTSKDTIHIHLESEELPKSYEETIKEFSETLWGRSVEIRKGEKIKELKLNKTGRIGIPKNIREHLKLEKYSYLMALTNTSERFILLKKAIAIQVRKADTIEWRIISPVPNDLKVYEKHLKETELIDEIKIFMKDPYP